MVTYREARALSSEESAYLTGLIDGEGTITLSRKHRTDNRQLVVSISSCERHILEYVLKICGVGKITGKRVTNSRHALRYTYAVTNRQALSLLAQIHPYFRSYKARRCELILVSYISLTPRNGKYSEKQRQARSEFEQRVLSTKTNG